MFLNYYLNNFLASDDYKEFIRNYKIYEFVQSVIICSIINEVEKRCYTSALFNSGDLKKELRSIYNEYSVLEKNIFIQRRNV